MRPGPDGPLAPYPAHRPPSGPPFPGGKWKGESRRGVDTCGRYLCRLGGMDTSVQEPVCGYAGLGVSRCEVDTCKWTMTVSPMPSLTSPHVRGRRLGSVRETHPAVNLVCPVSWGLHNSSSLCSLYIPAQTPSSSQIYSRPPRCSRPSGDCCGRPAPSSAAQVHLPRRPSSSAAHTPLGPTLDAPILIFLALRDVTVPLSPGCHWPGVGSY